MNTGTTAYRRLFFGALCSLMVFSESVWADVNTPSQETPLTIQKQGSFFIGGRNVQSDTLSRLKAYDPSGTITVDQTYVHYQIPAGNISYPPLVLVHGCCLTGATWETTPDGRMGWDEFFVRAGFPTYVVDQAGRGRSAIGAASEINRVAQGKMPPQDLPNVFSAGHEAAWVIFRFGPEYQKVFPGMQFPLDAQNALWQQMVADWSFSLETPNPTVPALTELANRLNGAVIVSHSQSGIYPFQAAALDNKGIKGIVALEPGSCPESSDDMTPYVNMPILVVFGDFVEQSPRWAPRLKGCHAFAQAANKAGGQVEVVSLPDIGINGNSHMIMMDKNSLQIADWLTKWLKSHAKG